MPRVIRAVLIAALVSISACGADEAVIPAPTEANVVGTYNLTIINGGNLPYPALATASYRIDIIRGQITLTPDRNFTDVLVTQKTYFAGGTDPEETSTLGGTWALSGSTLTMTFSGQNPQNAIVTGQLLSRSDQTLFLTYSK